MKKSFILILLCVLLTAQSRATESVYSWAVVPQFSPTIVHRDWTPLMNYLEQKTGYRFKLITADTFNLFERSVFKDKVDFAYTNPYQTVLAHQKQGYIPLVRDEQRRLTGILVVRRDSPYQNVKDIAGKRIAFASPNAFAVSLYMRALLREKEKIDFVANYVGTHSNAYRRVLLGRDAASGGVYRTLRKERPEVQDNLRVIYEAPSTITHAVIASPRVPLEVREAVQESLLQLADTEKGRKLLTNVFLPQPIKADFERDYKPLMSLNLEKYVVLPE